jgi:hypothetical protein
MRRKGRSDKNVQGYRDHVERLMGDWSTLPISMLGRQPELVRAHHDKLTREHGPYMANATMRSLRAIYNHARKTMPDLPANNPSALTGTAPLLLMESDPASAHEFAIGKLDQPTLSCL